MKLDKFVNKIKVVQDKYKIEPMSLLLLDFVLEESKKGEVTIMKILDGFWRVSSHVTTKRHLNSLIDKKVLKIYYPADGRKKEIVKGSKYDELEKFISETQHG
jgi:hypothetical protein